LIAAGTFSADEQPLVRLSATSNVDRSELMSEKYAETKRSQTEFAPACAKVLS